MAFRLRPSGSPPLSRLWSTRTVKEGALAEAAGLRFSYHRPEMLGDFIVAQGPLVDRDLVEGPDELPVDASPVTQGAHAQAKIDIPEVRHGDRMAAYGLAIDEERELAAIHPRYEVMPLSGQVALRGDEVRVDASGRGTGWMLGGWRAEGGAHRGFRRQGLEFPGMGNLEREVRQRSYRCVPGHAIDGIINPQVGEVSPVNAVGPRPEFDGEGSGVVLSPRLGRFDPAAFFAFA